ncbi:MAG TPA: tyrosine-type recombinase/integrase [Phycisphaerae bacterium]|nr:tyrosine-type recombinase/integrase [Phycisphaerae bacterium]
MADWTDTTPSQLLEAHVRDRPGNTARSYAADVATFAEYLEARSPLQALEHLLQQSRGAAERTLHGYLSWLRNRYGALSTIRRKVCSLYGLTRLAHRFRIVPWVMDPMRLPAGPPVRNTRGPSRDVVERMIEICRDRQDAKGARDAAAISLMAFAALRSNETLTLDLKHLDIPAKEVELLAKGLWGRVRFPIPIRAAEAIAEWLEERGDDDGPLFITLAPGRQRERLTYWGMYCIIRAVSARAGETCSPHKLRHFAATELLRLTNGNVPWAMALTRHRDPRTLMVYNDERCTRAREAMELLSAGIPHYRID